MTAQPMQTDILVIGGGLAGTFAAIKAREAGVGKVMLISKGKLGKDSVSTFAAGVFQTFFPEDDTGALMNQFVFNDDFGAGLLDEAWVKAVMDDTYERILDMDRWGVKWEKTSDGKLERIKARHELLKCMFPGPQMMAAMAKKVIDSGVEVIGHTMVTDLLTEGGKAGERVIGAVGFDVRTGQFRVFKAKATLLVSGGCGFKARFACHRFQTGDAYTAAYRAGAELGGFEIGEVLHTTCAHFDIQGLNMFVGLGGKFVNVQGEEFMRDYDPELQNYASMPRLSEASAMEVRAGRGPIYLDMTHFTSEQVRKLKVVCPVPTKIMERAGVIVGDRIVKKMEWAPAFFGTLSFGGGIRANTKCETVLRGLYTGGDAMAWNKHYGVLPGAAVSGARAGKFAAEYIKEAKEPEIDEEQVRGLKQCAFAPIEREDGIEPDHIIIELHETILPYEVTVISRGDRLERAIREVERIRDEEVPLLYASDPHYLRLANETKNIVLVAEMYLRSRLLREDSREGSAREDYPYTDNINWLKHTVLKQENGEMKLWAEDIPVDNYEVRPKREKYLYPIFEVARRRGIEWG